MSQIKSTSKEALLKTNLLTTLTNDLPGILLSAVPHVDNVVLLVFLFDYMSRISNCCLPTSIPQYQCKHSDYKSNDFFFTNSEVTVAQNPNKQYPRRDGARGGGRAWTNVSVA